MEKKIPSCQIVAFNQGGKVKNRDIFSKRPNKNVKKAIKRYGSSNALAKKERKKNLSYLHVTKNYHQQLS